MNLKSCHNMKAVLNSSTNAYISSSIAKRTKSLHLRFLEPSQLTFGVLLVKKMGYPICVLVLSRQMNVEYVNITNFKTFRLCSMIHWIGFLWFLVIMIEKAHLVKNISDITYDSRNYSVFGRHVGNVFFRRSKLLVLIAR